jgi:hypothetical protein
MEIIFDDFIRKSFNYQKFLEQVRENMEEYYNMSNFLERFVEINKNTSWDVKRAKVLKRLDNYFKNVESENKKYLKELIDNKMKINPKFIQTFEDEIKTKLYNIRKAFSTATPTELSSDNFNNNSNYGLIYTVTNIQSHTNNNLSTKDALVYVEFKKQKMNYKDFLNNQNKPKLVINESEIMLKEETFNDVPKYMNLYIVSNNNQQSFIGSYSVDVKKLDIMRPYKLKLESNDEINKTSIEVLLFKWTNVKINDEDSEFYNEIFKQPHYLYDNNLENEINSCEKNTNDLYQIINRNIENEKNLLKVENNEFLSEEIKKHNFNILPNLTTSMTSSLLNVSILKTTNTTNSSITTINPKLEEIIKDLFKEENYQEVILEWVKTSESSFEEILYAVTLVDSNTVTIYDKLKLLFDIGKMKNFLIFNEDKMTLQKVKELIYSIYKRYMVYFTKADVDRMVDYIVKKEKINNLKWALSFGDKQNTMVEEIVNENEHLINNSFMK